MSTINPWNVTTVAIQITQAQGITFSYFLITEAFQSLVQIIPVSPEYQYTCAIIWAEWLSRSQSFKQAQTQTGIAIYLID